LRFLDQNLIDFIRLKLKLNKVKIILKKLRLPLIVFKFEKIKYQLGNKWHQWA